MPHTFSLAITHERTHASKKGYDFQRVLDLAVVTQTHPSSVGRLMKTPPDRHINNLNFQRPAFTPDLLKLSAKENERQGGETTTKNK